MRITNQFKQKKSLLYIYIMKFEEIYANNILLGNMSKKYDKML